MTKFDDLCTELLLEIVDYLPTFDCFNAFSTLNARLESVLRQAPLSVDLAWISHGTYEGFYNRVILPHHGHHIRRLKLGNDLTLNLLERILNEYYLPDLKQLRSLTLIKPSYMTLSTLALHLPHLKQLQHLSIDSHSYPETFFRSVLTKAPSMNSCYLPNLKVASPLAFSSTIESLTVTLDDVTLLGNLLNKCPRLTYLSVALPLSSDIDEIRLNELPLVHCEHLHTLKIHLMEESEWKITDFLRKISFKQLTSFSFTSTAHSALPLDATRWNSILFPLLPGLESLHFFLRISSTSTTYDDVNAQLHLLQTQLAEPFRFSLSISDTYFIIHTDIYPKRHFDQPSPSSDADPYSNHGPVNCDEPMKYSLVKSLTVNSQALSTCAILPKSITHLQIQGSCADIALGRCLEHVATGLSSLQIAGLPDDLPCMPNLQKLTIQQAMFNLSMASRLASLCPRLALLNVEIDCMANFREILDQLRCTTRLTELKFLRVFSRDPCKAWSLWLAENEELVRSNDGYYLERNMFLFIWL